MVKFVFTNQYELKAISYKIYSYYINALVKYTFIQRILLLFTYFNVGNVVVYYYFQLQLKPRLKGLVY